MSKQERNGQRKSRAQLSRHRSPELGYYIIVTDTEETEQNYMYGLRDSIPKELQGRLVIKVKETKTCNLIEEALTQASLYPQYGEIWIVFDRDQVQNFDSIINDALLKGIHVGWTNPCIEEWFCAYFGKMPPYADSVKCCSGFSKQFEDKTGHPYVKSDKDIYKKLIQYGDEEKAIAIAKGKAQEHESNGNKKPSQQCPGTTMHLLVEEIKSKIQKGT